ncbi:ATP-binding protein [Flavihumibacter sp. ZG627]|uniref:hybrid sensor histidine kinase/response regulator n=1 Tax=Flavihumibacter sp. ZG627 TaxID=1463156 RepID=UPI00058084F2|nr:ATP-binding protein [Flavihumibacter sp. ZG627]KIC89558.1 histidine kinase [Flavihumibacter sp. ZG627]
MILIVDDKQENLFSLKTLLQIHGFEADTAVSGEEALRKILKTEYELIILDVQMPDMDGFEVAEAVSGSSKYREIPILFLSAVSIDKRFIMKGYQSGGVDYVTKPFDPDLLLLKVKTFCRLYQQSKLLNDAQATLEHKVEERTKELVRINNELELRNAELQQYAFIASHDLQEPLRKIQTFTRLVKEQVSDRRESVQYLERIINASGRMRNLIDDLLNYSRLSALPVFSEIDLNMVLNDTIADLEVLITEKGATIYKDNLVHAEVNPGQMRQLFQNLLTNALKFSNPGTPPVINIRSQLVNSLSFDAVPNENGEYIRLTIEDNGIGFDEQYLGKIFTIFQRLHTKDQYDGTGIGLAIVKKIVEKHNGIITATSDEGKGSAFIIIIPLVQQKINNELAENL